jgi:hypothetical protein
MFKQTVAQMQEDFDKQIKIYLDRIAALQEIQAAKENEIASLDIQVVLDCLLLA